MQTVYERCCGIDVHKKLIVACFRNGNKAEIRKYDLIHCSMQSKRADLLDAMEGTFSAIQKQLIKAILSHIDDMTKRIKDLDDIINNQMKGYEDAIKKIDDLPGIGKRSAEVIIAEIGADMSRFPSAAHLCSWTGLCPGNNESAGKRKSGKTNKGNKYLKSILIQCAKAAQKDKNSFFYAQYQRLVVRRGANRATVAVAHSMLIAIYHMLNDKVPFKNSGSDYYTKFNTAAKAKYYLRKLQELGAPVPVSPSI
jgi:hypothetical protein